MKIEPSDEAPKAALAGFTPLFGGAKIVLAETPKAVTPFGGLCSFIAYLQQIGFGLRVAQTLPFPAPTSPNAIPLAHTFTAFLFAVVKVQLLMKHDADARVEGTNPKSELASAAREALQGRRSFHWVLEFPEIFDQNGFDAIIGNPPFIGNKYWVERLPQGFGHIASLIIEAKPGKSDLIGIFIRRIFSILSKTACAGIVSTTTATEGDTLEVGLAHITSKGRIYRAVSSMPWPGTAGVHICISWLSRERNSLTAVLDGKTVEHIGPSLTEAKDDKELFTLATAPWGFIGCDNGGGEVLILREGSEWLVLLRAAKSPFLRVYLTGDDIATGKYAAPDRWVIDCGDLSLEQVEKSCSTTARFLAEHVEPARDASDFETHPGLIHRWWQMWNPRAKQYRQIRSRSTCLAVPVVAKYVSVVELPTDITFTNKICVLEKPHASKHVSLLSSMFEVWVIKNGGTMGAATITLGLTKCIQTFPLLPSDDEISSKLLIQWEAAIKNAALVYGPGYTQIFNAYHDRKNTTTMVLDLRRLKREIDSIICQTYDLSSLDLGHGFHPTKQGERYTISEPARRTVLDRLLALNHQRYAEEVKAGLHDKKTKKSPTAEKSSNRGRPTKPAEPELF